MPDHVVHTIEPVFDSRSRVLVLGSVPSPKSREAGFFYGHPQNRFWRVLAAVFDEPVAHSVAEKRDLLLRKHIALWDVVRSCDIEGASDASIRNAEPNDLARIFDAADIRAVFCTGAKAGELYARLCEQRYGTPCTVLPSTSPANAKASFETLVQTYGTALREHLDPFDPPVLNVRDVAELEHAIERCGTPLEKLMERAGRALAHATERLMERTNAQMRVSGSKTTANGPSSQARLQRGEEADRSHATGKTSDEHASDDAGATKADAAKRCVVLCGSGSNGGDGWIAARELAASGCEVRVVSAVAVEDIAAQPARSAAQAAAEALRGKGNASIIVNPDEESLERALDGADAVIDALFGTGFSGTQIRAPFDAWIDACNKQRERGAYVVAADVPSGLSAQTGRAARPCIKADVTVTMLASKPGLETPYAFAFCGDVSVAPIADIEPLFARGGNTGGNASAAPAAARGHAEDAMSAAHANADEKAANASDEAPEEDAHACAKQACMKKGRAPEGTAALQTRSANRKSARRPEAEQNGRGEFFRPEAEDDDGYDPYSDRRPEPEPLFQRDPWR